MQKDERVLGGVHLLTHPHTRPLARLPAQPPTHIPTHSLARSLTHPPAYSLTHSSATHSPTHLLTHSLIHSLTNSLWKLNFSLRILWPDWVGLLLVQIENGSSRIGTNYRKCRIPSSKESLLRLAISCPCPFTYEATHKSLQFASFFQSIIAP